MEDQFDAILSPDGDAYLPLLGDESGNWLLGDMIGILFACYLQANKVVTPVSSNTGLEKRRWFKSVVRTPICSTYVIVGMANGKSVSVGYEANGGFLLGNNVKRLVGKNSLPCRHAMRCCQWWHCCAWRVNVSNAFRDCSMTCQDDSPRASGCRRFRRSAAKIC